MKLWVIAVLGSLAVVAPAQLNYTFDTDNQGWQQGDLNVSNFTLSIVGGAIWNPAGYIEAPDFGDFSFHVSPVLTGSQDWAFGHAISFDYRTQFSDNVNYPFVVLGNGTEAIFQTANIPVTPNFVHYSYTLDVGNGWAYYNGTTAVPATAANIHHVLTTMSLFGVSADQHSGEDYTAVDNVSVVPEPGTMIALATGIVALLRRRKH